MAETSVTPLSSPEYEAKSERFKLVPELSEEIAKLDEELENVGRADPVVDASAFTTKELNYHMESRGLKASGFWADDIAKVQSYLDSEYAERVAEKDAQRAGIRERRELAIRAARDRLQGVRERDEEKRAVSKSLEARFWMKIFEEYPESAPRDVRMNVDPPLARVVAKMLAGDSSLFSSIRALDLSHCNVGDSSGVRLAKALETNTTLTKLELEASEIGHRTAEAVGDMLLKNKTLKYLSLESNNLLDDQGGVASFATLVKGLVQNQTLEHLNVWNCGLGREAGEVLASGLETENDSLTCLLYGCNEISLPDERLIAAHMDRNRKACELKQQHALRHAAEIQRFEMIAKQEQEAKQAMKEEEEWLERRKVERAEERRLRKEEEERIKYEAEQARIEEQLAKEKKIQEEKARAEARRAKKKKKKK